MLTVFPVLYITCLQLIYFIPFRLYLSLNPLPTCPSLPTLVIATLFSVFVSHFYSITFIDSAYK